MPIPGGNGETERLLSVARDITEVNARKRIDPQP